MISHLGYGELVGKADKWTRRHRFPSALVKNAAGILLLAILGGFGTGWAEKTNGLLWLVYALNILLFLIYFGRGSADQGFAKVVEIITTVPERLELFMHKLTDNVFPFAVNLAICVFVIIMVNLGLSMIFSFPVIGDFIRLVPFIDNSTPDTVFKAFFYQVWVLPLILSYSAVVIDWAFFKDKSFEEDV